MASSPSDFGVVKRSDVQRLSSEAHVLDDGSVSISETWNYNTKAINGINHRLTFNATKNERVELESVLVNGVVSAHVLTAAVGDSGVYTYADTGKEQKLKIYQQSVGETSFTINYRVHGLIKQYGDVQELNWMIFDGRGDSAIPLKLDATVYFPSSLGEGALKIFAHGDVASESHSKIENGNVVKVDVTGFYKNTFAEIRTLLPDNPLPNVSNQSNEPQLERFLAYERAEIEKRDAQIAQNKKSKEELQTNTMIGSVFWFIGLVCLFRLFRFIYRRYDAEDTDESITYYPAIPAYSPAVAARILNDDKAPGQAQLIATIFSLYTKKVLKLTDLAQDVTIELLYDVHDLTAFDLSVDEEVVYTWLLVSFGYKKAGTYKEFFNIKRQSNYGVMTFARNFQQFQAAVKATTQLLQVKARNGIGEKMPLKMRLFSILYGMYVLIMSLTITTSGSFTGVFLGLLYFIMYGLLVLYKNQATKLLPEGAARLREVRGLKQYLNDYSLLKDAEPQAVHLWEKYFVYGLALGVSKTALNKLYEHMPHVGGEVLDLETIYMMHHLSCKRDIVREGEHAIAVAERTVGAYTSRLSNDYFGSGDGFSGGRGTGSGGGFSGGGGTGSGGSSSSTF